MVSDDHPSLDDLARFLRSGSRSDPALNAKIVRHLLSDCRQCRDLLAKAGTAPSSTAKDYDYSAAFEAVDITISTFLSGGVRAPLAKVLSFSREVDHSASPRIVRSLIERSHGLRYSDPEEMLCLADLARAKATECDAETAGGQDQLEDLRGQAWGHFGNTLRVHGRLAEAAEALAEAERCLTAGTGNPQLRARLLEQRASLLIAAMSFDEAIQVNEEAIRFYRESGKHQLLAGALLRTANALVYSGRAEEAILQLNQMRSLIDPVKDHHLLLFYWHNLVRCYMEFGKPEEALACHSKAGELYRKHQDPMILLRATWQEGKLLREIGHLRNAEAALLRARKGFLERRLTYEVALISLDLADIYLELGLIEDLKRMVEETAKIFSGFGIDPRTLRPLLEVQEAAEDRARKSMDNGLAQSSSGSKPDSP
jgi:tetratricopeptide (TPR) repeat protein